MPASPVLTDRAVNRRSVTSTQRATRLEERVVAGRRVDRWSESWALCDVPVVSVRTAARSGDAVTGRDPERTRSGLRPALRQSYARLRSPDEVDGVARAV